MHMRVAGSQSAICLPIVNITDCASVPRQRDNFVSRGYSERIAHQLKSSRRKYSATRADLVFFALE